VKAHPAAGSASRCLKELAWRVVPRAAALLTHYINRVLRTFFHPATRK
jgi:hypothetical protein